MLKILKDFVMLFPDVDHQSLITKWPLIKEVPMQKGISIDRNVDAYHFDMDIYDLLLLVKMIPTHKVKFEDAVRSLILFSDVSGNKIGSLNKL